MPFVYCCFAQIQLTQLTRACDKNYCWGNDHILHVQLNFALVALGFHKAHAEATGRQSAKKGMVAGSQSMLETIIDDGKVEMSIHFCFYVSPSRVPEHCWGNHYFLITVNDISSGCIIRADSHILQISKTYYSVNKIIVLQVTLEEFTALMTGAIGGRDPMQIKPH